MSDDPSFLSETPQPKTKGQEGTEINDQVLDTIINDLYLPSRTDSEEEKKAAEKKETTV